MSNKMSDEWETCKLLLDLPGVAPGWGCCKCRTYNGIQRAECRNCSHARCDGTKIIIAPDFADTSEWN